jgi:hypothetical protein
MNENLAEILRIYATKTHTDLSMHLLNMSKDMLIAVFNEILTTYINDKNSSTLREFITVNIAGYEHSSTKIGYNGYKHLSAVAGEAVNCEAKPKNFDTDSLLKYKNGERKTKPAKLNGQGNFTDYTYGRFEKDKAAQLNMLISGFVDGRLIYIIEFPFNYVGFVANLEKQLIKRFPNGDIVTNYLRSASFDYRNFIQCEQLNICYLLKLEELKNYSECISKGFYQWLITKTA